MINRSDYCDRTKELGACIELHKQRIFDGRAPRPQPHAKLNRTGYSHGILNIAFMPKSNEILSDLSYTLQKLAKLKLLNDTSSLGDRMEEPHRQKSLCQLIKIIQSDISECNKSIKTLNKKSNELFHGINSDTSLQVSKHCQAIIVNLQSYLTSITSDFKEIVMKNKKLIAETDYQEAEKIHDQSIESFVSKKDNVIPQSINTSMKTPPANPLLQPLINKKVSENKGSDNMLKKTQSIYTSANDPFAQRPPPTRAQLPPDYYAPSRSHQNQMYPMPPQQPPQQRQTHITMPSAESNEIIQQQSQSFMQRPVVDQEIRQRDASMRNVEQTIVQLGEIYQQFTTLVAEQGDMVTRIDSRVDDSLSSVQSAHEHLANFLKSVTRRRNFMFKVFLVLILLFTVFAFITR